MNKKFIKGLFLSEFFKLTEANFCTHDSIPDTLMPEGNKSRVSGDGLESNRPATNFPRISVDSNRFDCLVEKSGLGVENRGADLMGASGWSRVQPLSN